jgi:type IV secretory pathway VirB2 component (pilin)
MWIKWIAVVAVLIIVSLGIAAIYGRHRWQSDTNKL